MCGLIGAYGPSAHTLKSAMADALARIQHRGPDAQGVYLSEDGACLLGHVRLSIVDLSEGANQPFHTERSVLVYNGEIYNHAELRSNSIPYNTHSDTETLIRFLETQSVPELSPLTGMFAGAFYEKQTRQLLLFRDALGIKPLYTHRLADGTLVFASEIKALFALLQRSAVINLSVLESYLLFENYPQGASLFADIQLLKPGTCLRVNRDAQGQVRVQTEMLSLPLSEAVPPLDTTRLIPELRHRLKQSVQSHLMSDVPLGVYLSGGIDSALVASLAARETQDLMAFTGYFSGNAIQDPYYDERPLSRLVAKRANIPLHEVPITPQDFMAHFDLVIYALDEPRMGMGAFSQYMVAKEAGKHRKVILAGHGGDELFAGYPLFKAFWLLEAGLSLKSLNVLRSMKGKEWPWLANLIMGYGRTGALDFAPRLYPMDSPRLPKQAHPDFYTKASSKEGLKALHAYYQATYLPGLLAVEDKISMAHSLETRVPLWTQPLIAWASAIPVQTKLRGGQLKALLKDAASFWLPPELLNAPKRGFPTPLRLWFRDSLMAFAWERLCEQDIPLHTLVSRAEMRKLLESHQRQPLPFALDERRAHRIWMLLCLESWMRQYRVDFPGASQEAAPLEPLIQSLSALPYAATHSR